MKEILKDILMAARLAYADLRDFANSSDEEGLTVAPDSLVRVHMKMLVEAIAAAETEIEKRPTPVFDVFLLDSRLRWARVHAGEDVLAVFKKVHGGAPTRPFAIEVCHPDTKFVDGGMRFTIPAGEWAPITVLPVSRK